LLDHLYRATKISKRGINIHISRQECTFDITDAHHMSMWHEVFHANAEFNAENVLPPVRLASYAASHFLQLRHWCSTVAYKANAELCSSPMLVAVAESGATAGGTVVPFLQHGTQMISLPFDRDAIEEDTGVWGSDGTFDGLVPDE
jgi:hypothetical protein